MPDDQVTIPSTADPQWTAIIALCVRLVVTILGVFGVSTAAFTESKIAAIAGAISLICGIAWSGYELVRQTKMRHAAAVVSARLGQARQYQDYRAVKETITKTGG